MCELYIATGMWKKAIKLRKKLASPKYMLQKKIVSPKLWMKLPTPNMHGQLR